MKNQNRKIVKITDDSYYSGNDYIEGRYYRGVYGGEDYKRDGRYIKVDDHWIKIGNGTKIEFEDEVTEDDKPKKSLDVLTGNEKQSVKVLNFMARFDGIIETEDEIRYILNKGIEKFIGKDRQHLVAVTETAYPIKIKIKKK